MPPVQSMLAAVARGRRVTIGLDTLDCLRGLSDRRELACPLCLAPVVLRAGPVVSPHFAHLPGAECADPRAEPETEEHRRGKALLARWAADRLPDATVTVEAVIAETCQRADVLVTPGDGSRYALEFQCADLSGREWSRRRNLYREAGVADLWILGGTRLHFANCALSVADLERAILAAGAPLLFLDALGAGLPAGSVARFRTDARIAGRSGPAPGRLDQRALLSLEFPKSLFGAGLNAARTAASAGVPPAGDRADGHGGVDTADADARLVRWLALQHGIAADHLPAVAEVRNAHAAAFACETRLWQACVYCRWVTGRVAQPWSAREVEMWARRHLPVAPGAGAAVRAALDDYAVALSAAGLLSLPRDGRAVVLADLVTLVTPPDLAEVERLAAYRRTLRRDG